MATKKDMAQANTEQESIFCVLCNSGDEQEVLVGHDRLHGISGTFRVVKCKNCGLMRTNPRPTREGIGKFYPDNYGPYQTVAPLDNEKVRPRWKKVARMVFDGYSQKVPPMPPGRMLEIGCASGDFLTKMAARGWVVEGIEFSAAAGDTAQKRGHRVCVATMEKAERSRADVDLTVGWMVLEHLHDPVNALRKLHKWSNADGWLALSVPDAGSWERRIFGDAWYSWHLPNHLYHYDRRTLVRMLEMTGWEVKKIFWHRNPTNLFKSLKYVCEDRRWISMADYFEDMATGRRHPYIRAVLGLMLGVLRASGRMTVWARKVDK